MHSDGQVDGWLCVCVGGMNPAPWQIQQVADFHAQVGWQREAVDRNGLVSTLHLVRRYVDAVVQMPDLRSLDLQDQHVVVVVVGNQASGSGRRDVGVDLYREVQLDLDGVGQRSDRAHVALNAVHNDRVAVGKVLADADKIEAAIDKPVAVRALFLSFPLIRRTADGSRRKSSKSSSTADGPCSRLSK